MMNLLFHAALVSFGFILGIWVVSIFILTEMGVIRW